jgi:hypothetical protein
VKFNMAKQTEPSCYKVSVFSLYFLLLRRDERDSINGEKVAT